jgi:hypothetical protein
MRSAAYVVTVVACLHGCAASGPETAWGKAGVTRYVYGTDLGMCTGLAAQQDAGSGANTAGGISGQNNTPPRDSPARDAQRSDPGGQAPVTQAPTPSSLPSTGTYSGTVSADYAQRAATQQRAQEMLTKRARAEAFRHCITGRGYREFTLTPQQRAHLATLKAGSSEYHEYLYTLGSDPAVVGTE